MNYELEIQSQDWKTAKSPAAPIAWMGGKSLHANWILEHFPDHRIYVEPYGGMANVLLKKQRSEIEIYNDLDFRLVNLFRVIRDPEKLKLLQQMCELTPYSRKEFESLVQEKEPSDPVQRAYWFFVRCRQARGGLGSQALTPSAWATSKRARRQMPEPISKYLSAVDGLPEVADRFRTVVVESLPALDLFRKYDSDDSLFYCDPPYPHGTLANQKQPLYEFTMSDAEHLLFLNTIKALEAKVIVSGYSTPVYDRELSSWRKLEKSTHVQFSNSGGSRSEVLWMNF
ncbi:DNA adenine methylase [Novipirellula rosea]|uniref:DNA adenine methylase n=1 Tax=Novipirellula rosea TaxID=1031540 RepID=A0ABP8N065_9BACT